MPVLLDKIGLCAVIDSLEVGVILLDGARRILHSNRWLALRSGHAAEALAGQKFSTIFQDAAGTRLERAIDHAIQDRLPSLLSPALHGTLLPLYRSQEDRNRERRMQQMIHVIPLQAGAQEAVCLIQISDMTANISRERLLRQQTETLRRSNTQDTLTGVANRRKFDERLADEFHRAQRDQLPLGLIIVDIDLFSGYNTHYGRDQGDARLAEIAASLRDATRPTIDLVARYGGEEFAIIVPGANEKEICQQAENLRLRINTLDMANAASAVAPHLTISIGATVMMPSDDVDTHALLSLADVALYQAKHDGRNRAMYFSLEDGGFKLCG